MFDLVTAPKHGVQVVSMAHVFHVWWLHGLTYKPMDAVLFLDIRSLVFSIHGKIRCALCHLHFVLASFETHALQHHLLFALAYVLLTPGTPQGMSSLQSIT